MKPPALFRSLIGPTLILLAAHPVQSTCPPDCGIAYTVDSTGDGNNVGPVTQCNDGTGHCTLRAAIQAANGHAGNDGIFFDISTAGNNCDASGNCTINLGTALPDLSDNVNITGPGPTSAKLTVRRNSATQFRIFNVTATGTVSFSLITITNGVTPDGGGGIQKLSAGTVNVTDCTLNSNSAASGGAIFSNSMGPINVTNSTLSSNVAGNVGGALSNASSGTVTISNSTLSGNSAPLGGGIFNGHFGTVSVTRSTILSNHAQGADGNSGGAGYGGAIYSAGTLNFTNCTLSGNSVAGGFGFGGPGGDASGGAIFVETGTLSTLNLSNCTVSGNTSNGGTGSPSGRAFGGGVAGNATVKSTIIANNTGNTSSPDVAGSFTSQGFNLIGKNDGAAASFPAGNPNANNDIVGTSASPVDPRLDPNGGQDNGGPTLTIALLFGSPAIDKGTSNGMTGTLTTDQRGTGFLRTFNDPNVPPASGGDNTDIGAFEVQTAVQSAASEKSHGAAGNFDVPLPLTGTAGVECRSGGSTNDYMMMVTFAGPITVTGNPQAQVTSGTGMVGTGGFGNGGIVTISGPNVFVPLTNIANAQTINVTLFGVGNGTPSGNVIVPMGVLVGDTNGNRTVNASDVSQTKAQAGQPVTASNFREDVNANGAINASDIGLVKSLAGTALPP